MMDIRETYKENTVSESRLEEKYDSIMRGMSSIYNSMFLIDLDARKILQLDNLDANKQFFNDDENYFEIFKKYLRHTVIESHIYDALTFCDVHTIKPRLRYKNVIDSEFIGKEAGWFRAQFIVLNRSQDGVPVRLVFTTQVIDKEKKAIDEQQKILSSLADIFYTIRVLDFDTDTVTEVSTKNLVHRILSDNYRRGCQRTIDAIVDKSVSGKYIDEMREFTDLSTISDRMKDRTELSIEFVGNEGWEKASFIKVESDSTNRLRKVLYATQIIDDIKLKEEMLIKNATTDELTGLYNRRAFNQDVDEKGSQELLDDSVLVFAIDVNGLKKVNDSLGHEAGDELILGTAECLKKSLAPYGKVYRTGGDEFTAILFADKSQAGDIEKDLKEKCSQWMGRYIDSISLACGYSCSLDYMDISFEELLKEADKRMYEQKEAYYLANGIDRRKKPNT